MAPVHSLITTGANYSCFVRQLRRKLKQIHENKYIVFSLDMVLGAVVFCIFKPNEQFADQLTSQTEGFISWLQSLIQWLMGNPAGLKLNKPLNTTVGNFFLYHIYLWRTYITFLKPALLYSLILLRWTAFLGLTSMLALIDDIFSLLTIHVFCFYVYAARLYQLQIAGLTSLWRLFRGKKYNPLRKRVDSNEFDQQQLFLGTLVFTVLFFLLPTVLVYYSVFTGLRMTVYLLQSFLSFCLRYFSETTSKTDLVTENNLLKFLCNFCSSLFTGRLL